jgi:DNA-binding transcriptional LysR family regulator
LGMAQPPLSQQIRSLERIVGYPLFPTHNPRSQADKGGPVFQGACSECRQADAG